jgi:hypothetical protein
MKKKINDILLDMQNNKICIGQAVNKLDCLKIKDCYTNAITDWCESNMVSGIFDRAKDIKIEELENQISKADGIYNIKVIKYRALQELQATTKSANRLQYQQISKLNYQLSVSLTKIEELEDKQPTEPKDFNYPCIVKLNNGDLEVYAINPNDNNTFTGTITVPMGTYRKGKTFTTLCKTAFKEL